MISYISGNVIRKNINSIILFVNGIGYEVFVPRLLQESLSVDDKLEIYTYLHVREDAWHLYGFKSWQEKEYFTLLLSVSGIGPKGALAIISSVTLEQLNSAILNENVTFLTKLPGIGKKTAQRLIVELKEKINIEIGEEELTVSDNIASGNSVVEALLALGYERSEIDKVYPKLIKNNKDADETTLIKLGLKLLAKI